MVVACIISSSSSLLLLLLLLKMENEGGPHVSLNWVSSNNPTVECVCKEETRAVCMHTGSALGNSRCFEALNKRDRSWCLPPAPPLGEEEETQGGSRAARLPCHALPTYRKEHGIWVGGSPCHVSDPSRPACVLIMRVVGVRVRRQCVLPSWRPPGRPLPLGCLPACPCAN